MEGIYPLTRESRRAVGQALTIRPYPGDGLTVLGAAALSQPNDILVVDARGYTGVSMAGFNMARAPRARGLKSIIVDGALRDADEFDEVGFPVFGRGIATAASPKRQVGDINVPVSCGGVIVGPGDLIVADETGIAVVPAKHLEPVWNAVSQPPSDVYGPDIVGVEQRRWKVYERVFQAAGGAAVTD
jgi:4-hydroxy-4-methyl-2-oxoglutarate aldolase